MVVVDAAIDDRNRLARAGDVGKIRSGLIEADQPILRAPVGREHLPRLELLHGKRAGVAGGGAVVVVLHETLSTLAAVSPCAMPGARRSAKASGGLSVRKKVGLTSYGMWITFCAWGAQVIGAGRAGEI